LLLPILEARGLYLSFGGLRAINNINLRVEEEEMIGLIGPNGAGKTTFFNILTGFLKPMRGDIFFRNEKITSLKPHEIAQKGIIRTFQITSIFEDWTLKENVMIGNYLEWKKNSLLGALFNTQNHRKQNKMLESKAEELLEFVGLADKSNLLSKNLTFGEKRRLEIAVALASRPKLLLLDEPASGMNVEECFKFIELINDIRRKKCISVLIVEHNMKVVMQLCDRVVVLNYGAIIAEGKPVEITNNKEVISIYLGKGVKV